MLDPEQIAQLRGEAGLSATPPSAGSEDIISQRKKALGFDEPETISKPKEDLIGGIAGPIVKDIAGKLVKRGENLVKQEGETRQRVKEAGGGWGASTLGSLEMAGHTAGQVAGGVGDILGGVAKPAIEAVAEPISKNAQEGGTGSQAIAGLADIAGQSAQGWADILSTSGKGWSDLLNRIPGLLTGDKEAMAGHLQENPETVKALEDFFNTASLMGGGKAIQAGKPLARETAGALATKGGELATKGAEMARTIVGKVGELTPKVGGLAGKAKGLVGSGKKLITGRTQEEILATPESMLHKLPAEERKLYFKTKASQVAEQSKAVSEKVKGELAQKTEQLQTEAEGLNKELATTARDKVIELRPKIRESLGRQSQEYRRLVDEELAPVKDNVIDADELKSFVSSRFSDNPELVKTISDKLGLSETGEGAVTTIGKIYDKASQLRKGMATGSKKGAKVFTADEKLTDDAISTLTEFMSSQGVDLKNARSFWAKYAPVRDQLVAESKPFVQADINTKTFANTLTRVAKGADVNNENFISEVENLLGEPVTKEAKSLVSKLSANEKAQIASKIEAETKQAEIALEKANSIKKLGDKEFEIARKAKIRTVIKRVIQASIGLEIAHKVKEYTGIGII